MKNARIIRRCATLLAPLAATFVVGCSSTVEKGESLSAIRQNVAPGLRTEDQRFSDVTSNLHLVTNDNIRKLNSDHLRFWLYDHSSRMSPYPSSR